MKELQAKLQSEAKRKGSKVLGNTSRHLVASRLSSFEKIRTQFEKQVIETMSGFNGESVLNGATKRMQIIAGSQNAEGIRLLCIMIDGLFSSDPKASAAPAGSNRPPTANSKKAH